MTLWLRLIWLLLSAPGRSKLELPAGTSILSFRVWPHDLDLSLHMTNSRYLGLMDLGRLDVILRSGLWRTVLANRWTPIANAAIIRFRRELRPFERFRLETRVLAWSDVFVVMEQRFVHAGGERDGHVAARALFKGALYDRRQRAYVPVERLFKEAGGAPETPDLPPEAAAFLAADEALRLSSAANAPPF